MLSIIDESSRPIHISVLELNLKKITRSIQIIQTLTSTRSKLINTRMSSLKTRRETQDGETTKTFIMATIFHQIPFQLSTTFHPEEIQTILVSTIQSSKSHRTHLRTFKRISQVPTLMSLTS